MSLCILPGALVRALAIKFGDPAGVWREGNSFEVWRICHGAEGHLHHTRVVATPSAKRLIGGSVVRSHHGSPLLSASWRAGTRCVYQTGNETFSEGEEEKVVVVNMAYLEQHVPCASAPAPTGIRLAHRLNTTLGQ